MYCKKQLTLALALLFVFALTINGQNRLPAIKSQIPQDFLKETGPDDYDASIAMQYLQVLGPGWGYNYDSLLADLNRWESSPFVHIDSIGASVQNRALWSLTIRDTSALIEPVFRIAIHARTHPQEVQSTWVTNEMIAILLGNSELGNLLRTHCITNIIPMYNPDGVELGNTRQNANNIDLESNWSAQPPEPEVQAIRTEYFKYMNSDIPVRIALNMHSSSRGVRHFVYHHANGTSSSYAEEERTFIGLIQSYWPGGIADWDEFVTWTSGTPDYYPESWFWMNYGDAVMALTYEDIYGETEYGFDLAASALLNGIADFLGLGSSAIAIDSKTALPSRSTARIYPNPVSHSASASNLQLLISEPGTLRITIFDILGRKIRQFPLQHFSQGNHIVKFNPSELPSGFYFFRIVGRSTFINTPFIITK